MTQLRGCSVETMKTVERVSKRGDYHCIQEYVKLITPEKTWKFMLKFELGNSYRYRYISVMKPDGTWKIVIEQGFDVPPIKLTKELFDEARKSGMGWDNHMDEPGSCYRRYRGVPWDNEPILHNSWYGSCGWEVLLEWKHLRPVMVEHLETIYGD